MLEFAHVGTVDLGISGFVNVGFGFLILLKLIFCDFELCACGVLGCWYFWILFSF